MPKSNFSVSQRGGKLAAAHLIALGRRARDTRAALGDVGDIFRDSGRARFESNARGRWAPLASSTIARKAREGIDPGVLRATHALEKSLTDESAPGSIEDARLDGMRFGTSVYYSRFHDKGEGVPQRKLIQLTTAERRRVTAALERFIARGKTGAF